MNDLNTTRFDLSALPLNARLWIFSLIETIEGEKRVKLSSELDSFLMQWHAHGAQVSGGYEFFEDRFIILAADQERTEVSGCSIDSMQKEVRRLLAELGAPPADPSWVFYRNGGRIEAADRDEFARLVAAGEVSAETPVFDTSIQTLEQYRSGRWELPMAQSWHARAFL